MSDRSSKDALFAEFAAVGKVLGNPKRLQLLDLLAQAPRSVEDLAGTASLGMSTCSAHLQTLREAGLIEPRREGKRIYYSLAGDDVAALWAHVRRVAQTHRPHTELARRAHLGPEDTEAMTRAELLARAQTGDLVILDVRPSAEFEAGHLPGAVSIPIEDLAARLDELPTDTEIVAYCRGAYCVMAHDAVRVLNAHGYSARRAEDGVLEWLTDGILRPHTAA